MSPVIELDLDFDREQIVDFIEMANWEDVYSRKPPYNIIKGISTWRYTKDLFACSEIKRLADLFNISYDKIQIKRFAPNFTLPPHIDYERVSAIIFPLYPMDNYEPIIFGDKEYHYNKPIAANTQIKHAIYGNGDYRINMQFDLDITLDEIRDRYI